MNVRIPAVQIFVGTAIRLRAEQSGVPFRGQGQGQGTFLVPQSPDRLWGPHNIPFSMYRDSLTGVMRLKRDVYHPIPPMPRISGAITLLTLYVSVERTGLISHLPVTGNIVILHVNHLPFAGVRVSCASFLGAY